MQFGIFRLFLLILYEIFPEGFKNGADLFPNNLGLLELPYTWITPTVWRFYFLRL